MKEHKNPALNSSRSFYEEKTVKLRYLKKQALILLSLTLCGAGVSMALYADPRSESGASQKERIDQMHHKLHRDQAPFKAKEAQALKELNEMTIRGGIRIKEVDAKIAVLMAAKTQIMRLRYGHLIEMRAILTDDQKVGYDRGILNRSAIK